MRNLFPVVAALMVVGAARAETLRLTITGVACEECVKEIRKTVGTVPSAKLEGEVKIPTKLGDPTTMTVSLDLSKGDVGDLARVLPFASELNFDAPGLTEKNAEGVAAALKEVKGVNAAGSKADVKTRTVQVQLDKKGGAKIADIRKALEVYSKK